MVKIPNVIMEENLKLRKLEWQTDVTNDVIRDAGRINQAHGAFLRK